MIHNANIKIFYVAHYEHIVLWSIQSGFQGLFIKINIREKKLIQNRKVQQSSMMYFKQSKIDHNPWPHDRRSIYYFFINIRRKNDQRLWKYENVAYCENTFFFDHFSFLNCEKNVLFIFSLQRDMAWWFIINLKMLAEKKWKAPNYIKFQHLIDVWLFQKGDRLYYSHSKDCRNFFLKKHIDMSFKMPDLIKRI